MIKSSASQSMNPYEEAAATTGVLNGLGIPVTQEGFLALVTAEYAARKEAERPQRVANTQNALKAAYAVARDCTADQITVTRSVDNCLTTETTKIEFYGDVLTVERCYSAGGDMSSYRVSIRQGPENTGVPREFSGSVGSSNPNREFVGRFLEEIHEILTAKLRGSTVDSDLRVKLLAEHIESSSYGA